MIVKKILFISDVDWGKLTHLKLCFTFGHCLYDEAFVALMLAAPNLEVLYLRR